MYPWRALHSLGNTEKSNSGRYGCASTPAFGREEDPFERYVGGMAEAMPLYLAK
jgi:hypothetical protein